MLGLLFRANKREKEILKSLRKLKTLRVSERGGMSIDSSEVLASDSFDQGQQKSEEYSG